MAAQPASTNDRRVTRLSISTTTTTLTPSTKAYATPPSSQTIPSPSSSSAVAPTLVDAFASLAVEASRPQQQEIALQTAERCSQNATQSAELRSVIVTRSTKHRSLTAAHLTEPRARASTRSPRTNRRDDEKQQDSLKSGTKVPSNSVDRLVKGIGAVQIHQPSASTHSQTTSPPVRATPAKQKRGRSDYKEENSIEERLAKLYVGPPPPPATSASTSASTSTPAVIPLSTTTTMTICTSMSHNRPAKTSPKGSERSESQLEAYGDRVDIALHSLRAARKLVAAALACESYRRLDTYMQCELAHLKYVFAHIRYLYTQSTDPARIEYQRMYEEARFEYLQMYEQMRNESQRKSEGLIIESQRRYEQAMIESQRVYEKVSELLKKSIQDARNKPAQQHRQLSQSYHQTPPQYKQSLEELDDKSSYPLLSKDGGTVPSSLPESVGGGSREDGDKTSEDHGRRRKRVKHDDIKKEPVDETMSNAATASTSFSTTTSTASTTSTFSTSSGHTVADVTLDMQNKLNFNPTTAISQ